MCRVLEVSKYELNIGKFEICGDKRCHSDQVSTFLEPTGKLCERCRVLSRY